MFASYIHEYYQKIKDGTEAAGHWVVRLYEIIIEGLENKSFYFEPKKATRAINFIEMFCHHCKGRSDLIKLELWQKAFISVLFPRSGIQRFVCRQRCSLFRFRINRCGSVL